MFLFCSLLYWREVPQEVLVSVHLRSDLDRQAQKASRNSGD